MKGFFLKRLLTKSIITKIMLLVVILGGVFSPLSIGIEQSRAVIKINDAYAQGSADAAEVLANSATPGCIDFTSVDITACAAQLIYMVLWTPTHLLVEGLARFQDYFLFYSISDVTYRNAFIVNGWKIIRDIANLFFIFGLLYTAIAMILQSNVGGQNPKKAIGSILIMALVVNFSLFFSRVIVDAGNILAFSLYQQINLEVADGQGTASLDIKPVGLAIIAISNPQRIILAQNQTPIRATGNDSMNFLIITILSTIFNVLLIFTFLSVGLMFLSRTISIYFAMVFSPIAFATRAFPGSGAILKDLSWSKWIDGLIEVSFMAPIYVFFLYLTILFLESGLGLLPPPQASDSTMQIFMAVLLPFALTMAILMKGKEAAKSMSGSFASSVMKAGGAIAGIGLGVATGGAALLGRGVVAGVVNTGLGKVATKMAKTKGKGVMARLSRSVGRTSLRAGAGIKDSSLNLRKTMLGGAAITQLNKELGGVNQGISYANIGTLSYNQKLKQNAEKEQKWIEATTLTGDAKDAHDKAAKAHNKDVGTIAERREAASKALTDAEDAAKAKGRKLSDEEKQKIVKDTLQTGVSVNTGAVADTNLEAIKERSKKADEVIKDLNGLRSKAKLKPLTVGEKDKIKAEIIENGSYTYNSSKVETDKKGDLGAKFNRVDDKGTVSSFKDTRTEERKIMIDNIIEKELVAEAAKKGRPLDEDEKTTLRENITNSVSTSATYTDSTGKKQNLDSNYYKGKVGQIEKEELADEINEDLMNQAVSDRQAWRQTWVGKGTRFFGFRGGSKAEEIAMDKIKNKYTGTEKTRKALDDVNKELGGLDNFISNKISGYSGLIAGALSTSNPGLATKLSSAASGGTTKITDLMNNLSSLERESILDETIANLDGEIAAQEIKVTAAKGSPTYAAEMAALSKLKRDQKKLEDSEKRKESLSSRKTSYEEKIS